MLRRAGILCVGALLVRLVPLLQPRSGAGGPHNPVGGRPGRQNAGRKTDLPVVSDGLKLSRKGSAEADDGCGVVLEPDPVLAHGVMHLGSPLAGLCRWWQVASSGLLGAAAVDRSRL